MPGGYEADMRKTHIDKEYILKCLNRELDEYIEEGDYTHKLESEFPKRYDAEASILSKMIFLRLLEIDKSRVKDFFSSAMWINGIKVSFDIMNNPKASKRDSYRLGNNAQGKEVNNLSEWEELKYTIGNFGVLPTANKKGLRHLQAVHNNKNERWDFLLEYCKEHWEEYSCDLYPSFRNYIIKTAQHVYVKEVLEDLKEKLGSRKIEDVEDSEFENWIKHWNNLLRCECKECEIISFGTKTKNMDDKEINEVVDLICLLIKVRGRMIITLLKQGKYYY